MKLNPLGEKATKKKGIITMHETLFKGGGEEKERRKSGFSKLRRGSFP